VVENDRAPLGRRSHVRETEPAVVRPGVGVEAAALERFEPNTWDAFRSALGLDDAAEPLARKRRVEPEAGLDREAAVGAVLVEREEERQAPDEVGRHDAHERAPLLVRLPDEPDVPEAQVAEAAVN
jgi:hypothetical protein